MAEKTVGQMVGWKVEKKADLMADMWELLKVAMKADRLAWKWAGKMDNNWVDWMAVL